MSARGEQEVYRVEELAISYSRKSKHGLWDRVYVALGQATAKQAYFCISVWIRSMMFHKGFPRKPLILLFRM